MKKLVLILPVLVLLLGGCGLVIPSAGPHHGEITFRLVDGETGEPLEGGYVFTNETWTACMKGIMTFGWQTTNYGNHQVWELSKKGEVTLPEYGYEVLRAEVYVKGYEKARFNLIRSSLFSGLKLDISLQKSELPEEYAQAEGFGPAIPVDKRHYKIPLKDITSDSEGWYRKLSRWSIPTGDSSRYLNVEKKMAEAIKNYKVAEMRAYLAKYPSDPHDLEWQLNNYYINPQWKRNETQPEISNIELLQLNKRKNKIKIGIIDSAREAGDYVIDDYGHGFFTATTIKKYFSGSQLRFYKVLNERGEGSQSKLAEAIRQALKDNMDIINIGVGAYSVSPSLKKAISKAISENKIIIAAGSNRFPEKKFYPADHPGVIKATAQNVKRLLKTNYINEIKGQKINNNSEATAILTGLLANIGDKRNRRQTIKLLDSKKHTRVLSNNLEHSGKLKAQWGVETHRAITEAALLNSIKEVLPLGAKLYKEITADAPPYKTFRDAILQGSKDEDERIRFVNHFWQKEQDSELTYFSSFVESDARTWGLKHSDNHYRWEDAIERYGYTNDTKRQSYYTLGFVAHLTQDMLVPEHVHDDPHAKDPLFNSGDPSTFEDFVKEQLSGNDDYINALAGDSIADITSPYKAFAEGNEFGYKQNLFIPETSFSRNNGDERDNAFGIGEYTVKTRTGGVTPPSSSPYEWGVYQLFRNGKFVGDFQFAEDGHDKTYRRELSGWAWLPLQWFTAEDEFWDVGLEAEGTSLVQKYYIEASKAAGLDNESVKPYTKPLLKETVKNSAGFLKLFHDLVNTPPYLTELQIYSGGGDQLYDGLLVKHMKTVNTDIMPLIRVESRELSHLTEKKLYRLPGSDPLEVRLHFNEPVMKPTSTILANEKLTGKEVTLVDKNDPEHTLILADNSGVEGEDLEPSMERKTWKGKLLLPDPAADLEEAVKTEGNYYIEVRAKDRHWHRSESGEMLEGLDLDPDPTTPALRKIGGGDLLAGSEKYVWSNYEQDGDVRKDKNHQVTIDSLRPFLKEVKITQGDNKIYEANWQLTTNSSGDKVLRLQNPKEYKRQQGIAGPGDPLNIFLTFSEPMKSVDTIKLGDIELQPDGDFTNKAGDMTWGYYLPAEALEDPSFRGLKELEVEGEDLNENSLFALSAPTSPEAEEGDLNRNRKIMWT